jgi:hypothetical protein
LVINGTETSVGTGSRLLRQQNIHVLFFGDLVGSLFATSLEEMVKPEMQQRFRMEKKNWFPRDDTPEHAAYVKRTPGLFKTELVE